MDTRLSGALLEIKCRLTAHARTLDAVVRGVLAFLQGIFSLNMWVNPAPYLPFVLFCELSIAADYKGARSMTNQRAIAAIDVASVRAVAGDTIAAACTTWRHACPAKVLAECRCVVAAMAIIVIKRRLAANAAAQT